MRSWYIRFNNKFVFLFIIHVESSGTAENSLLAHSSITERDRERERERERERKKKKRERERKRVSEYVSE